MTKINEDLEIVAEGALQVVRCRCGHVLGPASRNYKEYALKKESALKEAGPFVNPYDLGGGKFVFRQFCCPGCATLLGTEIAQKGEPFLWDIQMSGDPGR